MAASRLILIEGMIGSGKTTTAGRLGDWLSSRGEDVRTFDEGAADHPIRTRRVDELLAAPAPGDTEAYSASQWRQLAERCLRGEQTVILESVFLQNSVMPAFIYDAPADVVTGLYDTILAQVAPAEPFLLYLRPADLAAAVARAKGKVVLEASGGVTLETVRAIAETGVDVISVGALTHSAPALDIGLDA